MPGPTSKIAHIVAVVDASGDRLLVDRSSGALPEVRAPPVVSGDVGEFCRSVHRHLGMPVYALRCLRNEIDPGTGAPRHQVHLVESACPLDAASRSWRAVDCAQIKPFAIPPHGGIFDPVQAMQWRAGDRPWWQAGFAQASRGWLEETAPILGAGRILAVEHLRSWEIAWLVRVTTEHGAWYLKCSPAPLDIEADVIERLTQLQPKRVPRLVARYRAGSGFLMPAYPEPLLTACDEPAAWIASAAEYARLQVAAIDAAGDLVASGVPLRTSADLQTGIGELFSNRMNSTRRLAGIRDDELGTLRNLLPRVTEMIRELDCFDLPLTIDHGDLWAPNILVGADGPRFLDWSDASISQPFFSMLPLLSAGGITAPLRHDPRLRTHMRQAYLQPWKQLLGKRSLMRAWKIARPLAALHLAADYLQRILPLVETEHQVYGTLAWFLRLALRHLD
jgi:fructosamine-3-kinase